MMLLPLIVPYMKELDLCDDYDIDILLSLLDFSEWNRLQKYIDCHKNRSDVTNKKMFLFISSLIDFKEKQNESKKRKCIIS